MIPPPGIGLRCDRAMMRALEEFAKRELRGEHPWAVAAGSGALAGLRAALARATPETETYQSLLDEVLAAMGDPDGGWTALGLWRIIAYAGPDPLRQHPAVGRHFLARLREIVGDRRTRTRYLADAVEEALIREHEPRGGPLWRLVPVRPGDLVDRTPPEPGAEPAVVDLAPDERRHLASVHGHRIYAWRGPDGIYLAVLAGPASTLSKDTLADDEVFASAGSLPGLLRTVASRIGFHGAADWTRPDLVPYFPRALPDWWPH